MKSCDLPKEIEQISCRAANTLCKLNITSVLQFLACKEYAFWGVRGCGESTCDELIIEQERIREEHKELVENCAHCKWWDTKGWDKKLGKGYCKRYAPLHFDIQGYRWPCSPAHEWCGEFKEKEE